MNKVIFICNDSKLSIPSEFKVLLDKADEVIQDNQYSFYCWYDIQKDKYLLDKFVDYVNKVNPEYFALEYYLQWLDYFRTYGTMNDNPFESKMRSHSNDEVVIVLTKDATDTFVNSKELALLRALVNTKLEHKNGATLWHWYDIDYFENYENEVDKVLAEIGTKNYARIIVNNESTTRLTDGEYIDEPFHVFSVLTIEYTDLV